MKSIGNEAITFNNKKEIHLNKNCKFIFILNNKHNKITIKKFILGKNIEIYNKEIMKIGKSCC